MYYLLPFGIFVQICGWGMNIWVSLLMEGGKIKTQTQYIEGVLNVMDMTRMTKKWNTTCLNANGLTKLNGFVCTSCF